MENTTQDLTTQNITPSPSSHGSDTTNNSSQYPSSASQPSSQANHISVTTNEFLNNQGSLQNASQSIDMSTQSNAVSPTTSQSFDSSSAVTNNQNAIMTPIASAPETGPVQQESLNTAPLQTNSLPPNIPALSSVSVPPNQASLNMQISQAPSLSSAYLDHTKPGITLGVLSIVFALLVPYLGSLIGFILGIVAIVKGFGSKVNNAVLGILGIVAIPLSIISVIIWSLIIINLTSVKYSDTNTYKSSYQGTGYSFEYPKEMTVENSSSNVVTMKHSEADLTNSLMIFSTDSLIGINTQDFRKVFQTNEGDDAIRLVMNRTITKDLMAKDISISNYQEISSNGLIGFSKDIAYTESSKGIKIKGRLSLYINKNNSISYTMMIFAPDYVWDKNINTWDKLQNSVKENN